MLDPGQSFGPYKIISQIGKGGMGEVYRARDDRLERDVAIKILTDRMATDPEAVRRFEREAKALAAISHPNILAIHDVGRQQQTYFTASELLEGETLRSRLNETHLSWRKALEIGIAISDGLAAAHSKGIIHCDLKPENIYLTSDGQIKILDFGLAHVAATSAKNTLDSLASTISREPEKEKIVGTVGYMSPEQVRGEDLDSRCDIFALGCILYEMLTGKRAFMGNTVYETVAAVLSTNPPDMAAVPHEVQRIVAHCLEKTRSERLQSAHDLAFDLRSILNSEEPSVRQKSSLSRSHARSMVALFFVLLIAAGLIYLTTANKKRMRGIAVLPFVISSSNSDLEYLSEGLTDNVISNLAKISGLRVMARTTVMRYKDKQYDLDKIAKELQVEFILVGKLMERKNKMEIRAELVRVKDGSEVWSRSFHGELNEMPSVHQEISNEIVKKLEVNLTENEGRRFSKKYTQNAEAYESYLRGRYYWNKRTKDGLKKGIEYFQRAIDKDPAYSLAYAGLADSYSNMADFLMAPPSEYYARARAEAERALEIDEEVAESHTSLGHIYIYYWNFDKAKKEFERALELKPGYATAHQWYANYLMITEKKQASIEALKDALDLDPLSAIITQSYGYNLFLAGHNDQAIDQLKRAIELDPNFPSTYFSLGDIYVSTKKYPIGIELMKKAISLSPHNTGYLAGLGSAYALSGDREKAQEILTQLMTNRDDYVSPVYVAMIYAGLGDKDKTFEWLERAYQEHSEYLVFIRANPHFAPMRGDPRFDDISKRIGLLPL